MSAPTRLGDGGWERSDARQVVDRALRFDERVDPAAEDRVWARIDRRRGRGVRLAWPMFAAGAVCAVVASFLVVKLARRETPGLPLLIARDGSQKALRLGEPIPAS